MAASTDLFRKGTNNFSTTLGAGIGAGDTTISLASTTNLPTDTAIDLVIDRVDANGNKTPALREYVKGVVSGTTLITAVRGVGNSTAQTHSIGAVVEYVFDQNTLNDIANGILTQHNQDGSHGAITATSLTATGVVNASAVSSLQDTSIPLSTYRKEAFFDFIASGGVWSGDSYGASLNGSMTALTAYINGQRGTVSAVTAHAFTASKDTYVDILNTAGVFTLVYTEVANNAASPALAANSLRLAIIVSGANIAAAGSVNQGQETSVLPIASSVPYAVTDSLGNLICPRDPSRKVLGYRQITSNFGKSATLGQITGLSVPVIVPTGRKIKATLVFNSNKSDAAADIAASIWDGVVGSGAQVAATITYAATANFGYNMSPASAIITPSSASKTYNAGASGSAGSQTYIAAANSPGYLLIELV